MELYGIALCSAPAHPNGPQHSPVLVQASLQPSTGITRLIRSAVYLWVEYSARLGASMGVDEPTEGNTRARTGSLIQPRPGPTQGSLDGPVENAGVDDAPEDEPNPAIEYSTGRQTTGQSLIHGQDLSVSADRSDRDGIQEFYFQPGEPAIAPQELCGPGVGDDTLTSKSRLRRKPLPQEAQVSLTTGPLQIFNLLETTDRNRQQKEPKLSSALDKNCEPQSSTQESFLKTMESNPLANESENAMQSGVPRIGPSLIPASQDEGLVSTEHSRHGNVKDSTETSALTNPDELVDDRKCQQDLQVLDSNNGQVDANSSIKSRESMLKTSVPNDGDASSREVENLEGKDVDAKPPLPPRPSEGRSKWSLPRKSIDVKSEMYQVKNIRWHDRTSAAKPRTSPILLQNRNGPCPLVALVNALILTTPADAPDRILVDVMKSRQQISLSLILNAVLEELVSSRQKGSKSILPDVSDLYAFLQSLHTGMNVNPRFVPYSETAGVTNQELPEHTPAPSRREASPGTFEDTMEMSLYAAFSIPLIHGWLPPPSDPAYTALERRAVSYEEAQNLLFREEELEQRALSSENGLTEQDQQLYSDIIAIKLFLDSSATQLTEWGIKIMREALRPGSFAILFRNDHFSTLYCHPQTAQLLTLVTDAGYDNHDEVVWESLVDVNGRQTEYFSGDFRVVGTGVQGPLGEAVTKSTDRGRERWASIQGENSSCVGDEDLTSAVSEHEQKDRDLALALQLQEEEDQRHREEQARRKRERILSEQYIEQQARRPEPFNRGSGSSGLPDAGVSPRQPLSSTNANTAGTSPSHRQSTIHETQQQQVRPLVPPRRTGTGGRATGSRDEAPPSYEQAAHSPAYVPPVGHPSHADSGRTLSANARGTSLDIGRQGRSGLRSAQPATQASGRRRPASPGSKPGSAGAGNQGKERECLVM